MFAGIPKHRVQSSSFHGWMRMLYIGETEAKAQIPCYLAYLSTSSTLETSSEYVHRQPNNPHYPGPRINCQCSTGNFLYHQPYSNKGSKSE